MASPAYGVRGELVYSSYAGDSGGQRAFGIAVAPDGSTYIAGSENTLGDAFLAKVNPTGDQFEWIRFLGGSGSDFGQEVGLDAAGNAYLVGNTASDDFPGITHGFRSDGQDVFVAKFDPAGNRLYTHLFGGDGTDFPVSIAVDPQGNAWITGHTNSGEVGESASSGGGPAGEPEPTPTFTPQPSVFGIPIAGAAFQTRRAGNSDMFIAKLAPSGALLYSTYLGGSGLDEGDGVAIMPDGGALAVGDTRSKSPFGFPTVAAMAGSFLGGLDDAVIVRLGADGNVIYSTHFGGSDGDRAFDVAVDTVGNAYIVGRSSSPNFPTTLNAYQTASREDGDAFLAKMNPAGTQVLYATFIGGNGTDIPRGVGISAAGDAFLTGTTDSTDFPVRDAIQNQDGVGCGNPPCGRAVWVSWLRLAGQGHQDLLFSTYLGGDGDESAEALALGPTGLVHVTGYTGSTDFPRAGPQVEDGFGGDFDVFLSKIAFDDPSTPAPSGSPTLSRTPTPTQTGTATVTRTRTSTSTITPPVTSTPIPTVTSTGTATPTPTPRSTATHTATRTATPTATPRCGDDRVDRDAPFLEDCDDGNNENGDACPADCKYQIVLSPRMIIGKGFCADQPIPLEVQEVGSGRDITRDADVTYEWIDGVITRPVLDFLLAQAIQRLVDESEEEPPQITIADITVGDGMVTFASAEEGLGVNLVRAKRSTQSGEIYSNIAFVIAGIRLLSAESLEIEATSLGSTIAGYITDAVGQELENPPMVLFSNGPFCNGTADFIGTAGEVSLKSLKFDLFGGLISDVALLDVIETTVGVLRSVGGPIGKLAAFLSRGGVTLITEQFLDFEVNSEAAGGSEKEGSPPVTMDGIISVSDSFSLTPPFFKGVVNALAPGISSVQATFDMEDYCLGKASDSMLVWVAPNLERVEIRNEQGLYEEVLELPVRRERTPRVVGMLNAVRDGEEPHELPFDPLEQLPDRVQHVREFIEQWIPGAKDKLEDFGVPVTFTIPSDAELDPSVNLYRGGAVYFTLMFTWNPFAATVTINELRLQVPIPSLPLVTTWTLPVPPNLPTPVATVDESAGVLTGARRGNGQVSVDVCVPFFTSEFTGDINSIRVTGRDLGIYGITYEDVDGDRNLDLDEPGLSGWTIEALSNRGAVVASTVSGANGLYELVVPEENLPAASIGFELREVPQAGWGVTEPIGGTRSFLIDYENLIPQNFGNFRDVTVGGVKFDDRNGSALQDNGEPGLPGWTIELTDTRGRVQRATTVGDGRYAFTASYDDFKGAGEASIREVLQSGWRQIFPFGGGVLSLLPRGVPLHSGMTLSVNFANRAFTVTPTHTHTRTRTSTPTATQTRRTPTPGEDTPTPAPTPQSVIAGTMFEDLNGNGVREVAEPGLAGWTIFLDDDGDGVLDNPAGGNGVCNGTAREVCVLTDGSGDYGFTVDEAGGYTVREVLQPGWLQTTADPDDVFIAEVGQSHGDVDFGKFRLGSIAGTKFRDLDADGVRDSNEPGLPGWTIFVDRNLNGVADGDELESVTAADGTFVVGGLPPGPFVLRERERCGFRQTLPVRPGGYAESGVASGAGLAGRDFGNRAPDSLPGDTNGNGRITAADLILMLYGSRGPLSDANENGRDDADDFAALIAKIFECADVFLPPAPIAPPTASATVAAPTPTTMATAAPTSSVAVATVTSTAAAATPTAIITTQTHTRTGTVVTPGPTGSRTPTGTITVTPNLPTASSTTGPSARVYCSSLAAPLAIPDGQDSGISDVLALSDTARIDDLNLRLEISHPYVGDLVVTLTHQGQGAAVTMLDRPGVPATALGCSEDDVRCVLDDESSVPAEDACEASGPALDGILQPLQSLSAFESLDRPPSNG